MQQMDEEKHRTLNFLSGEALGQGELSISGRVLVLTLIDVKKERWVILNQPDANPCYHSIEDSCRRPWIKLILYLDPGISRHDYV